MTEPKAPSSDLDAAVKDLAEIAAAVEFMPGKGIDFTETRAVRLAANLRLILSALSSQSQAAEGMAKALEPVDHAVIMTHGGRLLKEPTLRYIEVLEGRLHEARTALSHYRSLGGTDV